jgi:hypothetical protein
LLSRAGMTVASKFKVFTSPSVFDAFLKTHKPAIPELTRHP